MKVKVLRDANVNTLEREINSFISGHKDIVDIKISSDGHNVIALIMYK
ncbi:hypothetical protein [Lysinibacillus capsici]